MLKIISTRRLMTNNPIKIIHRNNTNSTIVYTPPQYRMPFQTKLMVGGTIVFCTLFYPFYVFTNLQEYNGSKNKKDD